MSNPSAIGFQTGRRWMMIVAMLAIGAMLLAACGGDDDDDDEPTAPPATEAPAEETPTEAPAASPAASPMASPVGSPAASPVGSPAASPVAPVEDEATPAAPAVQDEATPAGSPVASPGASPVSANAITVDMTEFAFEPSDITIPANTDVEVTITNSGSVLHDFTVDELGIAEDVDAGASTTITINAAAGAYEVVCTQPGHLESGMVGTLTVQ